MNTAIARDFASVLEHLELPILTAHLSQRVLCAESAAKGLSVVEAAPQSEAAREMAALVIAIARIPEHEARKAA